MGSTQRKFFRNPDNGSGRDPQNVIADERYVVTAHGKIVAQGPYDTCARVMEKAIAAWKIERHSEYAASRRQPHTTEVLIGWAHPGERNFLWSHQQVFADELTPGAENGLKVVQFLHARGKDSTRIFLNKLPIFIAGDWIGVWKELMVRYERTLSTAANT